MAKSLLKIKARKLRSKGISVVAIAKELNVSKSTASIWTKDIFLTMGQLEELRRHSIEGAEKGRLIGALKQKEQRAERIATGQKEGNRLLKRLSERDLFIAGIALYWAEGNKRMKKIEFCNSDPKLILMMLHWFQQFFHLTLKDFKCYLGINQIHIKREQEVKNYWSHPTGLSLSQFTKTSFKKTKPKKIYANFNDHYGTLAVKIIKPRRILYNVAGLVEALRNVHVRVAQW